MTKAPKCKQLSKMNKSSQSFDPAVTQKKPPSAILQKAAFAGAACALVGEDGFEPSKLEATDLQSAPFGHSGTLPYSILSQLMELVDGLEPPTC